VTLTWNCKANNERREIETIALPKADRFPNSVLRQTCCGLQGGDSGLSDVSTFFWMSGKGYQFGHCSIDTRSTSAPKS